MPNEEQPRDEKGQFATGKSAAANEKPTEAGKGNSKKDQVEAA